MRRLHWCTLAVLVPSLFVLALSSGCNGGKKTQKTGDGPKANGDTNGAELTPLATMARGTLKGKVTLSGSPPGGLDKLTSALQKQMNDHKDKNECLAGTPEEIAQQDWKIGENGGVGDVIVWLQPPEGQYFQLSEEDLKLKDVPPPKPGDYTVDIKAKEVVLDQPHCAFIPRVFALFPSYNDGKELKKPTGQKLIIKNSAKMSHNTKREGGPKNRPVDRTIPAGKSEIAEPLLVPDTIPVTFQCNLHTWMRAYARVFDHPFVAVTKKDGTYEIPNVPADVELRVIAWHQPGDTFLAGRDGEKITIKKGDTATKDFTIKAK